MSRALTALCIVVVACHAATKEIAPDAARTPLRTPASIPRAAGPRWAAIEENVAVALPPGLFYCPLPEDRNGVDRAQTFFLIPVSTCDRRTAVADDLTRVPSINIYAVSSLIALEQLGGLGEPRSALDLARATCPFAEDFADIEIFGRHAVGCRAQHGDTIRVTLFALADDAAPSAPAKATVTLRFTTISSRLVVDWSTLRAIGSGIYVCDRVPTGRTHMPPCPADGPW